MGQLFPQQSTPAEAALAPRQFWDLKSTAKNTHHTEYYWMNDVQSRFKIYQI